MRIEVHQRGGVLGLDRRYLVEDGSIEVIDKGRSRRRDLEPAQAARIGALAESAAGAPPPPRATAPPVSDAMETAIAIHAGAGAPSEVRVRTGDDAPPEVFELLGELRRASGD